MLTAARLVNVDRGVMDARERTSTHLLRYHDYEGSQRRTPDSGNGEQLHKSSQISTPVGEVFFAIFKVPSLDISIP